MTELYVLQGEEPPKLYTWEQIPEEVRKEPYRILHVSFPESVLAVRSAFGPGGLPQYSQVGSYTLVYLRDEVILCADCATVSGAWAVDVYWEGPPKICSECDKEIESSYGDPDEEIQNE